MRIGFCEIGDRRIGDAISQLASRSSIEIIKIEGNGSVGKSEGERAYRHEAYSEAVRQLHAKRIDGLIVGAQIALAPFLRIFFSVFGAHRAQSLLFSAAPVFWIETSQRFIIVDPCVVVDPTPSELGQMARAGLRLAEILFSEPGRACLLSHATGFVSESAKLENATIERLEAAVGKGSVFSVPLQLDAALRPEAARTKIGELSGTANVLVCKSIQVANLLYKSLEVFARGRVRLSGAVLMGLPHGYVGLLPRTVQTDEIILAVEHLLRLFRHDARERSGDAE